MLTDLRVENLQILDYVGLIFCFTTGVKMILVARGLSMEVS